MASFGGLFHLNYNVPGLASYEELLEATHSLGGVKDKEEIFRRMVFNIVARNQDDHVKNFAFLMNSQGQWRLSPAYDVTYANGGGYTRAHQMRINGKMEDIERADIEVIAHKFDIRDYREIIDRVVGAVEQFPGLAADVDLNTNILHEVKRNLRLSVGASWHDALVERPRRESASTFEPRNEPPATTQASVAGICRDCQKTKLKGKKRIHHGYCSICDPKYLKGAL